MTTPTVLPPASVDTGATGPPDPLSPPAGAPDSRGSSQADPDPTRSQSFLRRHPDLAAWLPGIVLAVVMVAVHIVLSRHMRVPIIHADEYGYLMGAHFMAEGGPPTGMPYYPGYSLLLVPLWWISSDTATVYHWALDVNAGLAGVTVLLLYGLARRLAPAAGRVSITASVVAVAAYPSLLLYSNLTESENLLIPAVLAILILFWRAIEAPTARRWATVGVASGLLVAVHGRGLAMAGAFVVAVVWLLRPWRAWERCLAAGLTGMVFALGVAALWIHWVTRSTPGLQLPSFQPANPGAIGHLFSGTGLEHFGMIMAGQTLYMMAAAGALLSFGVASFLVRVRRPSSGLRRSGLSAFALIGLGAAAVVAAVFLDKGVRLDDVIYGRYIEIFAVPVLLGGALALSSPGGWRGPIRLPRQGRDTVLVLGVAGAVVLLTALVTIAFAGSSVEGAVVRTNVLSASDLFFGISHPKLVLPVVAGVALGGLVIVSLMWRASVLLGLIAALGLYVPATQSSYSTVVNQSAGAQLEQTVPAAINAVERRLGPGGCVSWDDDIGDAWAFFNTRLFVPDTTFPVFQSSRGQRLPCASGLVVSDRDFGAKSGYQGARAVAWGNDDEVLWAVPGPTQFSLGAIGWLLPPGFPGPLSDTSHHGSLSPASGQSSDVTASWPNATQVTLELTHAPGGTPWPDAISLGAVPQYAVRLALAWYPSGTSTALAPGATPSSVPLGAGRADLVQPLLPGASEPVTVKVVPWALGSTPLHPKYLAPGRYDLEVSVIQESVGAWDATLAPLLLHVTVKAG